MSVKCCFLRFLWQSQSHPAIRLGPFRHKNKWKAHCETVEYYIWIRYKGAASELFEGFAWWGPCSYCTCITTRNTVNSISDSHYKAQITAVVLPCKSTESWRNGAQRYSRHAGKILQWTLAKFSRLNKIRCALRPSQSAFFLIVISHLFVEFCAFGNQ